jgi:hypothetical protein
MSGRAKIHRRAGSLLQLLKGPYSSMTATAIWTNGDSNIRAA